MTTPRTPQTPQTLQPPAGQPLVITVGAVGRVPLAGLPAGVGGKENPMKTVPSTTQAEAAAPGDGGTRGRTGRDPKVPRTTTMSARVTDEMRGILEGEAAAEFRSVSEHIFKILWEHCYLNGKPSSKNDARPISRRRS